MSQAGGTPMSDFLLRRLWPQAAFSFVTIAASSGTIRSGTARARSGHYIILTGRTGSAIMRRWARKLHGTLPALARIQRAAGGGFMSNSMHKIEHIVVLMLENRSFDNLLGWIY